MTDPRRTNEYRVKRAKFLAHSDLICHWCGRQTYTSVKPWHPMKATIDHLIEVDLASSLALDTSAWVVACGPCNSSRGASFGNRKPKRSPIARSSREW